MNLWQRFNLWIRGYVYVEHRRHPGWSGSIPFYMFRCPIHGLVEDYAHGYWDIGKGTIPVEEDGVVSQLICPLCTEERLRKVTQNG
uniref:Uncharacterized protein n=1 Tax=viral metagenome TaxID=1070528 RepID=A0A6M3M551_9ZZZZ